MILNRRNIVARPKVTMGGAALRLLALPGTYIFATDSNVSRLLHDGTLNSPE